MDFPWQNTTHELVPSFAEKWLILPFDCAEMQGITGVPCCTDFNILPLMC
jgi:hypothetical protein